MRLINRIVRLGAANIALVTGQVSSILMLGLVTAPSQLGLFMLGLSIAQPFSTFATVRFDSAFPSATTLRQRHALLFLSCASMIAVTLLAAAVIGLLSHFSLFELQKMGRVHILAILALVLSMAGAQMGRYWAICHADLHKIEHSTYARGFGTVIVRSLMVGVILLAPTKIPIESQAAILLVLEVLVSGIAASMLAPHLNWSQFVSHIEKRNIWTAIRRNWKFPLIETPSTMLDSFALNAPIYLVTQYFGLAAAGSFGLAFRAMAAPAGQLGLALTEVIQSHCTQLLRNRASMALLQLFLKSSAISIAAGAVASVAGYFLIEPIVVGILGPKFMEFAQICAVIVPWVAFAITVNLNSRLLPLLRRQELKLIYDIFSIVMVGALAWAAKSWTPNIIGFSALISTSQCIGYVIYWLLIRSALTTYHQTTLQRQST